MSLEKLREIVRRQQELERRPTHTPVRRAPSGSSGHPPTQVRGGQAKWPSVTHSVHRMIVEYFAQTGEWCETARLIFGDDPLAYPPSIRRGALEARREYLAKQEASE